MTDLERSIYSCYLVCKVAHRPNIFVMLLEIALCCLIFQFAYLTVGCRHCSNGLRYLDKVRLGKHLGHQRKDLEIEVLRDFTGFDLANRALIYYSVISFSRENSGLCMTF